MNLSHVLWKHCLFSCLLCLFLFFFYYFSLFSIFMIMFNVFFSSLFSLFSPFCLFLLEITEKAFHIQHRPVINHNGNWMLRFACIILRELWFNGIFYNLSLYRHNLSAITSVQARPLVAGNLFTDHHNYCGWISKRFTRNENSMRINPTTNTMHFLFIRICFHYFLLVFVWNK